MDDNTNTNTNNDWRSTLPEEYRGKYEEFKTPADLMKSYDHINKAFSGKKETLKAEIEAEFKAGIPKSVDEYKFSLEGKELDQNLTKKYSEVALNLGLKGDQANELLKFYDGYVDGLLKENRAKVENELKNEWLNDYDTNAEFARKALNKMPENIQKLFDSDPRYGDDPNYIRLLHTVGKMLSDKPLGDTGTGASSVVDSADTIKKEMADSYLAMRKNTVTSVEYKQAEARYRELQGKLSKIMNS